MYFYQTYIKIGCTKEVLTYQVISNTSIPIHPLTTATLAYTVLEVAQDGDVVNILGLDFYENSGYLVGTPDATDWG